MLLLTNAFHLTDTSHFSQFLLLSLSPYPLYLPAPLSLDGLNQFILMSKLIRIIV